MIVAASIQNVTITHTIMRKYVNIKSLGTREKRKINCFQKES